MGPPELGDGVGGVSQHPTYASAVLHGGSRLVHGSRGGFFWRGMERGVGSGIPPVLPAARLCCSPGRVRGSGQDHRRVPRRELSLCPKFVGSAWIPPEKGKGAAMNSCVTAQGMGGD